MALQRVSITPPEFYTTANNFANYDKKNALHKVRSFYRNSFMACVAKEKTHRSILKNGTETADKCDISITQP